jgi:uncharacterized protein (DUF342 family)
MDRYKELSKEITALEKNIANLELGVKTLLKIKAAGALTPDKAANLEKANAYVERLKLEYQSSKEEHEVLKKQIEEIGYGTIKVLRSAYPGTKIVIGPESLTLQTEHSYSLFLRGDEGITFKSAR